MIAQTEYGAVGREITQGVRRSEGLMVVEVVGREGA